MEAARITMVDTQVRPNDVTNSRLISAMKKTPREDFLPDTLSSIAYAEAPLETSPGRWLWIARDFAKMIEEADIEGGERVLVIAAGSGYAAAVLAGMGAQVTALEDDAQLVEALKTRFADRDDVEVVQGDLKTGGDLSGPFDAIFVGGAVEVVPERWVELVGDGGRLMVAVREGDVGRARIYYKSDGVASARTPFDCLPPRLAGFESPETFRF